MFPSISRFLLAGAGAGVAAAVVNLVYFVTFRRLAHWDSHEPTFPSVVVSSLAPPVLAAVGYYALSRWMPSRATLGFVLVTSFITIASFEGVLRNTLPDGTAKPPGFDALVMPMHVVVGLGAILVITWLVRG